MRDNKDDSKGISCNGDTSHLPFGGGIAGHSPKVLGQNYIWSERASLKMKDESNSPTALLLLKDRMTDWTAKVTGKKCLGRGYACSRYTTSEPLRLGK